MERLDKILAEALALPREARGALVAQLLNSIDEDGYDEDAEALWAVEIRKRVDDIDAGRVKMIPWEETEAKLRSIIDDAAKG